MVERTQEIDEIKQQIQEVMAKDKDNLPPKSAPLIEEALKKVLAENISLKEALGFSEDIIEEIYEQGYHLFQSGKYQAALPLFSLLNLLESTNPRFIFAIAACHHHAKDYAAAAGYYMLYEGVDPVNPLPYYHLYDCFRQLGYPQLAHSALNLADRLAGDDPKYAEMKGKIELELTHLKGGSQEKQELAT
jgi:type III secretion system low calcium response chaperone LcrH/SycD